MLIDVLEAEPKLPIRGEKLDPFGVPRPWRRGAAHPVTDRARIDSDRLSQRRQADGIYKTSEASFPAGFDSSLDTPVGTSDIAVLIDGRFCRHWDSRETYMGAR